jgi:hypothetical protein
MVWLSRVVFSKIAFDDLIYDVVGFKGIGCFNNMDVQWGEQSKVTPISRS